MKSREQSEQNNNEHTNLGHVRNLLAELVITQLNFTKQMKITTSSLEKIIKHHATKQEESKQKKSKQKEKKISSEQHLSENEIEFITEMKSCYEILAKPVSYISDEFLKYEDKQDEIKNIQFKCFGQNEVWKEKENLNKDDIIYWLNILTESYNFNRSKKSVDAGNMVTAFIWTTIFYLPQYEHLNSIDKTFKKLKDYLENYKYIDLTNKEKTALLNYDFATSFQRTPRIEMYVKEFRKFEEYRPVTDEFIFVIKDITNLTSIYQGLSGYLASEKVTEIIKFHRISFIVNQLVLLNHRRDFKDLINVVTVSGSDKKNLTNFARWVGEIDQINNKNETIENLNESVTFVEAKLKLIEGILKLFFDKDLSTEVAEEFSYRVDVLFYLYKTLQNILLKGGIEYSPDSKKDGPKVLTYINRLVPDKIVYEKGKEKNYKEQLEEETKLFTDKFSVIRTDIISSSKKIFLKNFKIIESSFLNNEISITVFKEKFNKISCLTLDEILISLEKSTLKVLAEQIENRYCDDDYDNALPELVNYSPLIKEYFNTKLTERLSVYGEIKDFEEQFDENKLDALTFIDKTNKLSLLDKHQTYFSLNRILFYLSGSTLKLAQQLEIELSKKSIIEFKKVYLVLVALMNETEGFSGVFQAKIKAFITLSELVSQYQKSEKTIFELINAIKEEGQFFRFNDYVDHLNEQVINKMTRDLRNQSESSEDIKNIFPALRALALTCIRDRFNMDENKIKWLFDIVHNLHAWIRGDIYINTFLDLFDQITKEYLPNLSLDSILQQLSDKEIKQMFLDIEKCYGSYSYKQMQADNGEILQICLIDHTLHRNRVKFNSNVFEEKINDFYKTCLFINKYQTNDKSSTYNFETFYSQLRMNKYFTPRECSALFPLDVNRRLAKDLKSMYQTDRNKVLDIIDTFDFSIQQYFDREFLGQLIKNCENNISADEFVIPLGKTIIQEDEEEEYVEEDEKNKNDIEEDIKEFEIIIKQDNETQNSSIDGYYYTFNKNEASESLAKFGKLSSSYSFFDTTPIQNFDKTFYKFVFKNKMDCDTFLNMCRQGSDTRIRNIDPSTKVSDGWEIELNEKQFNLLFSINYYKKHLPQNLSENQTLKFGWGSSKKNNS